MLRPEKMVFTSIVCAKKHVESILEALSSFGEFHIEPADAQSQSLSEFDQTILRVEEDLTNVNEIGKQLVSEKTSLLDIFKSVERTKTLATADNWQELWQSTSQHILQLKKQFEDLNVYLSNLQEKTAALCHLRTMLAIIDEMGADLEVIGKLKIINVEIASLPHKNFEGLKVALSKFPIFLNRCYLSKQTDFACLVMPAKYSEEIDRILRIHHAETFQLPEDLPPDTMEALKEINNKISGNAQEEKKALSSLAKLSEENRNKVASWKEITENILAQLHAKKKILQSGRLATIKGFVPEKKFGELSQKVNVDLEGKALVLPSQPAPVEDPPTKFSHGRLVAPFEELTKLYGLPHYEELDPTPLIAITFPLIFGLMFGDIGHGLLLLVGGLTVGTLIKRDQPIKNVCWILAACGIGAIIAGALYGEFFGIQVFAPLWFSPFDNVFTFLIFSLVVGVAQIMSGLVLDMTNFLLKHNVADAVLTSIPKMAFYIGGVLLVVVYKLNIAAWFSGPILLLIVPFIFLVFAKPTYLAFQHISFGAVETQIEQNSLGQRLFESGDLVTRLLSNTISYTRILALLMAHWAFILVTYRVAGLIGTASVLTLVLSGIIIVGGNIFVLALEGLIVFIHTLRLHFYEWFNKFYQGTGTPFQPFKQKNLYTKVIPKTKEA